MRKAQGGATVAGWRRQGGEEEDDDAFVLVLEMAKRVEAEAACCCCHCHCRYRCCNWEAWSVDVVGDDDDDDDGIGDSSHLHGGVDGEGTW